MALYVLYCTPSVTKIQDCSVVKTADSEQTIPEYISFSSSCLNLVGNPSEYTC